MIDTKYYLLTIKRSSSNELETVWYEGTNLSRFIIIEQEFGSNTVIINHIEISKMEYEYAQAHKVF